MCARGSGPGSVTVLSFELAALRSNPKVELLLILDETILSKLLFIKNKPAGAAAWWSDENLFRIEKVRRMVVLNANVTMQQRHGLI